MHISRCCVSTSQFEAIAEILSGLTRIKCLQQLMIYVGKTNDFIDVESVRNDVEK